MSPFPVEPARAIGPMRIVLTTYPNPAAARRAIDAALTRRLAACANLVPIDARYWWRGEIESATESMVLFKTVPKRVGALLAFLEEDHPYTTPEVLELDVPRASRGYLEYLASELRARDPREEIRRPVRRSAGPRGRGARAPGRTQGRPHRRSKRTGS